MNKIRNLVLSFLRIVFGVYLGACVYGCAVVNQSLYPVPRPMYEDGPGIIKLASSGQNLISARHFPAEGAEYTVLYCHGNGEDLGNVDGRAYMYNRMGLSFFAIDYQGYGTSEGKPREKNTFDDIQAGYEWLTSEQGIPPDRILLHGFSVGGSIALDLASKQELAGLILESTFVSAFRVVTHYPILPFDKYRNKNKIRKLTCPVLFMHGKKDNIVRLWHGQYLYERAPPPKFYRWYEHGDHNTMAMEPDYVPTLRQFVQGVQHGEWGELAGVKDRDFVE